MPKALITGVTGQDGSYLTEFLLDKGYEVCGLVRPDSGSSTARIDHLLRETSGNKFRVVTGDLTDDGKLTSTINDFLPHEVYNLAAQSFIPASFERPIFTADVNALGPVRILESIRNMERPARFFQASTCEIFGALAEVPQTEETPFRPRNPYATSKLFAHWSVINFRQVDGIFACNGILFNHESPRRGPNFVTRKITLAAARIKLGVQDKLLLGNLEVRKDWGYAGDYVVAMWMMLQQDRPDDFVISSGESHSLSEFLDEAFGYLNLDWREYVEIDPRLYRPSESGHFQGDSSKAERILSWRRILSFRDLVRLMTQHDLTLLTNEMSDGSDLVTTTGA